MSREAFEKWWDTTANTPAPDTYKRWEESCRQTWQAATAAITTTKGNTMTLAHITRLMTFAHTGQPKEYAASDMMRSDLEALLPTQGNLPDAAEGQCRHCGEFRQAATAAAVPPGYKLVPVEPTQEMIEAPFSGRIEDQDVMRQMKRRKDMADNYRAMLGAAPKEKP